MLLLFERNHLMVRRCLCSSFDQLPVASYQLFARMDDRATKLRCIEDLRRRNEYVSASALHAVIEDLVQHGVPELHNRKHLLEAREQVIASATPYGALHQFVDLTRSAPRPPLRLEVAHPLALLWHAFQTCEPWRELFLAKHDQRPSSPENPWSMALYSDEVTPGAVLQPQPTKKAQAVYFSFIELGVQALAREEAWFTATTCRSKLLVDVHGNLAQLMGAILKLCCGRDTTNALDEGILLRYGERCVRFHFTLSLFIQDGGAHKAMWHCVGDGGTRFCVLCKNVVSAHSELEAFDPSGLLRSNIIRRAELVASTDAEIKDAARRIAHYHGLENATQFKLREQVIGFSFQPYNLCTDAELDSIIQPASQFVHDWMHGLFANGVFNDLLWLLLRAATDLRHLYNMLEAFVLQWVWPKRIQTSGLHKVFDPRRREGNNTSEAFRCQASDGLCLVPVLACWVSFQLLPLGCCPQACRAFLAFADVIECITSVARGGVTDVLLLTAIERFLALFTAAFGEEQLGPKFHWLLHFPDEFRRHGCMISCFVHERKHKVLRRYANDVTNMRTVEHSIIGELTCHHLSQLRAPDVFNFNVGLVHGRPASARLRATIAGFLGRDLRGDLRVAAEARFDDFETCQKNDVVLVKKDAKLIAGAVWLHFELNGQTLSIVSEWTLRAVDAHNRAAEWLEQENPELHEITDITTTLVWTRLPPDCQDISTVGPFAIAVTCGLHRG